LQERRKDTKAGEDLPGADGAERIVPTVDHQSPIWNKMNAMINIMKTPANPSIPNTTYSGTPSIGKSPAFFIKEKQMTDTASVS
jgi:hypothetical protein